MTEITHRQITVNGLSMHIAEAGTGPLVVFCHGFPESWYSWRHQLKAVAAAGFHAVAPDQRGYGDTDAPEAIDAYTIPHMVGDIVALIGELGESEAVVVGHDWGSPIAWNCALMRPDLIRAVASLSVPTGPRTPFAPMAAMRAFFGDRFFYQIYFQTPGIAEHELQHDVAVTMRKMLVGASGSVERKGRAFSIEDAPRATSYMLEQMEDPGENLPDWLSAQDVATYVAAFEKSGFRGGLNWYRNIDRSWELGAVFQGAQIRQPALFVAGDRDVVPFTKESEAGLRAVVTNLHDVVVIPGVGHWTQQEAPEVVNEALIGFLQSL